MFVMIPSVPAVLLLRIFDTSDLFPLYLYIHALGFFTNQFDGVNLVVTKLFVSPLKACEFTLISVESSDSSKQWSFTAISARERSLFDGRVFCTNSTF